MELKSFKEILLRKSEENSYLQTLIKYAKDDFIADIILESLIKMAEPSAAMGRDANSAITSYAGQMDRSDVEQMRHALGHHISHYKGALKTHQTATDPKVKQAARAAADQHLDKIVPLMHLAARASRHSNGKMTLDYPSTVPWETNYTRPDRFGQDGKHVDPEFTHAKTGSKIASKEYNGQPGKLIEGTKDLRRRPKDVRESSRRGVPDYRYLEMPPHPGHGDSKRIPHKGGYPFEEVQLGSPSDKDQGKAYLPIEDIDNVSSYVPHPFDNHPVHEHEYKAEKLIGDHNKEKYAKDLAEWKASPHHKKWLEDQRTKFAADKEKYLARGKSKPKHVFDGLQLHEAPDHVKQYAGPVQESESDEEPQQASAPAVAKPPAAAAPSGPNKPSDDEVLRHIKSTLSPEQIKKMTPEMRKILKLDE